MSMTTASRSPATSKPSGNIEKMLPETGAKLSEIVTMTAAMILAQTHRPAHHSALPSASSAAARRAACEGLR
jgi:hypothetical protein